MYGLPKDTELSFLLNGEVTQICVGSHDLQIRFVEDFSISLQGEFDYAHEDQSQERTQNYVESSACLMALLGRKIAEWEIQGKGTLALRFDNSALLRIHDSSERYESYQIYFGKDFIVV